MFLTIFTPTYNRAYTLPNLYASLCRQTDKDFEWLIVDDGSKDNTCDFVALCKENTQDFLIRYIHQENKGKPAAHNRGVEEALGELFVCVDSDDYLTDDAVESLKNIWETCDKTCIGIVAAKVGTDGKFITRIKNTAVKTSTLYNAYAKYGLSGDTMLIYKTEVVQRHSFPITKGEKFIPEGYLYDRLDQEGELQITLKGLYICEYLQDGYTASMKKVLYTNPKGYFLYINQRLSFDKGVSAKFFDSIRYMAMAIAHKKKGKIKEAVYPFWAFLAWLPGWLYYRKAYRRFQK